MTGEMVERVAKAISRRALELVGKSGDELETSVNATWRMRKDYARMAIEAMMEPTESLMETLIDEIGYTNFSGKSRTDAAAMVWNRAIGECLREGE